MESLKSRFTEVESPEYGICQLEVVKAGLYKIFRLVSEDGLYELAVGVKTKFSDVDCELMEDETYYYLTSYLEYPLKTVRVYKSGIVNNPQIDRI